MRSSNAASLAVSALVLLGCMSSARAADSDTARARALFEAAGDLERDGRWSAAQERLRAALRLRETPQLHFALGWALENDDKLIEAKVAYETAAKMGRERAGGDEARRLAIARLVDLETMTPRVRVRIGHCAAKAQERVRVIVDGSEIVRSDNVATTLVNPGSHVVRVECGPIGTRVFEHMVYVGRSAERTVDVDTRDAVATSDTTRDGHGRAIAASTRSTAAVDRASDRADTFLPWVAFSGGIAFALGGGALVVGSGEGATERQVVGLTVGGLGLVSATVGAMLLFRSFHPKNPNVTPTRSATAAPVPGGGMATTTFSF